MQGSDDTALAADTAATAQMIQPLRLILRTSCVDL